MIEEIARSAFIAGSKLCLKHIKNQRKGGLRFLEIEYHPPLQTSPQLILSFLCSRIEGTGRAAQIWFFAGIIFNLW